MPAQKSSGTSASLTVGAALTSIASATGLASGENLLFRVDTDVLDVAQSLIIDVRLAAQVGGAARSVLGAPFTVPADVVAETPVLVVPSGAAYEFLIALRGGSTARAIPWSVVQIERT